MLILILEGIPEKDGYFYKLNIFCSKNNSAGNAILLKLALVQKKSIYGISCFTTSVKNLILPSTYEYVCVYRVSGTATSSSMDIWISGRKIRNFCVETTEN